MTRRRSTELFGRFALALAVVMAGCSTMTASTYEPLAEAVPQTTGVTVGGAGTPLYRPSGDELDRQSRELERRISEVKRQRRELERITEEIRAVLKSIPREP